MLLEEVLQSVTVFTLVNMLSGVSPGGPITACDGQVYTWLVRSVAIFSDDT